MAIWQVSNKTIKKLKIGVRIALILGFLYYLPSLLLRFSSVQEWIGERASRELSTLLRTPVQIGRISAEGWRELSLSPVIIYDSLGREALKTRDLRAVIDLEALLREEVRVQSLRLFDLQLLLDQNSRTGRSNVQHIIEALSSDSDEPSTLVLDLKHILVRNAGIELQRDAQRVERIDSLNLKVGSLHISPDSIQSELEELSLRSASGFRLRDMKALVSYATKSQELDLKSVELYLPQSYLSLPHARLALGAKGLGIVRLVQLRGLNLVLSDLSPLYKPLHAFDRDTLRLSTNLEQHKEGLELRELEMSLSNLLYLRSAGRLELDSLGALQGLGLELEKLLIDSRLGNTLSHNLPELQHLSPTLEKLRPLGQISYQGRLDFTPKEQLKTQGRLTSELGQLELEAELGFTGSQASKLRAEAKTSGFNLRPLLGKDFGQLKGAITSDLSLEQGGQRPLGQIGLSLSHIELQGQSYHDVEAKIAGGKQGAYTLQLGSRDRLFPLEATGGFRLHAGELRDIELKVQGKQLPVGRFASGIERLSLEGELKSSSLNLDELLGSAQFPLLQFDLQGKHIDLSGIKLSVEALGLGMREIQLNLPWARASLYGKYRPKTLIPEVIAYLKSQIPIFANSERGAKPGQSQIVVQAELDSIPQALKELLNLPIDLKQSLALAAEVNLPQNKLELNLNSPETWIGKHRIEGLDLHLKDSRLQLKGNTYLYGGTQLIGAGLDLKSTGNHLVLDANLGRDSLGTEQGHLALEAELSSLNPRGVRSLKDLKALVSIAPSRLRIHTNQWDIAEAKIAYAGGPFRIDGLSLTSEGRRLSIEGGMDSWAQHNGLNIQLENINLRYILRAAGVYFDLLDTDLTGNIQATLKDKHLVAQAQVTSPSFFVNKHDVGGIDIGLRFSSEDMTMHLDGDVSQKHGGKSGVLGFIKLENGAGLDLSFDAQDLDLSFVGSFMTGFLSKLEGYGTGKARLHGIFADGVTVEGNPYIKKGRIGVSALGTEYRFEHQVELENERIHLEGIRLYDDEGNSGLLRGSIGHKFFDNFDIQLRAEQLQGIKVLQTTSPKLMPAYGKAYASGVAKMQGTDKRLLVEVDLESKPGTDVMLDFNTITAGRDEGLMRFVRLKADSSQLISTDSIKPIPLESSSAIDLKLKLNITPEARLAMRLGEDNNSILKGRAEGVLQINAPSNGDPEVYGTLAVKEGEYLFNLQQLALKRFTVKEGGTLAFRGDATRAVLGNLNAVYALTANIADLDERISQLAGRTNIPVHCLLNLSGEVTKPQVRFGLELPGADAEVERRVRALLNTEDAITRQMLYLIALGKFYTSDADTRSSSTTDNWTAVASSAISEQLSSILGGLSENIKLGTSIKTKSSSFEETDIELNFSGSWLGNRLSINGNIGYHDNPYLNNQYLGEFEFEYRLNRSGSLRLKGYNRYNTMYQYLRQSLLTQGFGILYRQRFDSLKDLLRPSRLGGEKQGQSSTDSIRPDSTLRRE